MAPWHKNRRRKSPWDYLKKSFLQKSLPSRLKHLSVRLPLQS